MITKVVLLLLLLLLLLFTEMERHRRATSGSQLELRCSKHVTHIMWHTSLCTTIYNTHPPHQAVYLRIETFPIIPFARTAAAVLLPVASAPPPAQHPPVGSDGRLQVFAHHSHHSCVIMRGVIRLEPRRQTPNLFYCCNKCLYVSCVTDLYKFVLLYDKCWCV